MPRLECIAVAALFLALPDVPTLHRFQPQATPVAEFPPDESLPLFPDLSPTTDTPPSKDSKRPDHLDERGRIEILRAISGEFARAVRPIPAGKKGFHIKAGQVLDETMADRALMLGGTAAGTGDQVQVTQVEFHDHQIVIDINGGARQHTRWRDRIHMEVGAGGIPTSSTQVEQVGGAQGVQRIGATLYLDFKDRVPELSPDQIKRYLSPFLDFSKERSAAVQWVQTLPPEFQQAIKDKRAAVGMNQDMVIAAMGRPDKKIRERDDDGNETEDWIYGQPPARTVFVKFSGEKVISVKQYPK